MDCQHHKVLLVYVFIDFYITVSLLWDVMMSYQTCTFIIGETADLQGHDAVHFEVLCALGDLLLSDEKAITFEGFREFLKYFLFFKVNRENVV